MIEATLLKQAYKKLKSSVYFDKTQLILRDKIVDFESQLDGDKFFDDFADKINNTDKFKKLQMRILRSISIKSFPKKLKEDKEDKKKIVTNFHPDKIEIEEAQHFIDMDIRGHILGVVWLMKIGYIIDNNMYAHSFGNRIRKGLINELSKAPTYSPYLFEPYFVQYEGWRDNAMDEALKHMNNNQDIVILTMDLKRYYYSVDMNEKAFDHLYNEVFPYDMEDGFDKELNNFIYKIVHKYSTSFGENVYKGRSILPIGFLPSNVIANWYLKNFDRAIVEGWNPIYYGRYVDDMIIVDKIEHNSTIYQNIKENDMDVDSIMKFFLLKCSKWQNSCGNHCPKEMENMLLKQEKDCYKVNNKYGPIDGDKSEIFIQNKKLKIFYFRHGETDALITCFKERIARNKSEFRHMPEDEAVFRKDDYSEIYNLKSGSSPNKFREIEGLSVDRYELSKFIGKHLRIGGMIEDIIESKFERDIHKIFDKQVIIENYILWEKIIQVFVINERFSTALKFIQNIISAIDAISYDDEDETCDSDKIKRSLLLYLHSSICRPFALVWNRECTETINEIEALLGKKYASLDLNEFEREIKEYRLNYCKTRMIDKSVMPVTIDMLMLENITKKDVELNFTHFYDVLPITKHEFDGNYIYYPYLLTMYDFSMIISIEQLHNLNPFKDLINMCNRQNELYLKCNYITGCHDETSVEVKLLKEGENVYHVSVGNDVKHKLSVAIANVKLDHGNFKNLVKYNPNRSYNRYKGISSIVNTAIDNKVDILIMPESFVPYEWLSTLARTCAKNNLAVVTGIEHICYNSKVYNLTAVILPYSEEQHKCAYISFHLKTHYAPSEIQEIRGYRLQEEEGKNYELYKWNDCYFPVYCCYELTSIKDRALFQSYADFLVAIEWNRDVNYYSNIVESLSRDLHCYCIQVNSSDYGDSRITKPTRTEEKDIIRTKGGRNSTILVDTIDIAKLRDFQLKEYVLQKKDGSFKTTPPNFDVRIIEKKIRNLPIYEE